MYKYCICIFIGILQDSLMASAERNRGGNGGGRAGLVQFYINQWWRREEGAQCLDLSIGRSTLCQINPVRLEGREGWEESAGWWWWWGRWG